MPKPFDKIYIPEIVYIKGIHQKRLAITGVEAEMVCEILNRQDSVETPDLEGVQDFELQKIYESALEDAVTGVKLMREIRDRINEL